MQSVVSGNRYLTLEEMTINAQYILNAFIEKGWTKESVCGMLGNMQSESTINPGIWEGLNAGNMSGGYGLVQWTPASKYIDWANNEGYAIDDIDGQINRIVYEVENGLQWISTSSFPMTFKEFTQSTDTTYNLAMVFIANYERPLEPNQPIRGTQAEYWYTTLTGGTNPHPTDKQKKMPLWMYGKLF